MKPSDSVGPLTPNLSDNPRRGFAGIVSFISWFKEIEDWIAGLSPGGATQHDTGMITSGLAFTPVQSENITYSMRRRGKTAIITVTFTYIGPTVTGDFRGNVIDQQLFVLPTRWRAMGTTYDLAITGGSSGGAYRVGGRTDAFGRVYLTDAPPTAKVETGEPLRLDARIDLP